MPLYLKKKKEKKKKRKFPSHGYPRPGNESLSMVFLLWCRGIIVNFLNFSLDLTENFNGEGLSERIR